MLNAVHVAPEGSGESILGKTLPDLLYDSCEQFVNHRAFNQREGEEWTPLSSHDFKVAAEEIGLGLVDLGLSRGDRVGLFMESDVYFCLADMGCLIAGMVDAPVYVTHTSELVHYVLNHAEVRALFVSAADDVERLGDALKDLPSLETVIVAFSQGELPKLTNPQRHLMSLDELRRNGRRRREQEPIAVDKLRAALKAEDLATIIYTSGTTGRPKGVMLSHQNISSNALTAFAALTEYDSGARGEVVLSFLPLTHIFARTLQYGFIAHGSSVYFSDPDHISADLKRVRPTIFATVPRLLEKVYTRIREKAAHMKGLKRRLLYWSLDLAEQFDVVNPPRGIRRIKHRVADLLVYRQWREALGGRVKYIISGGAALNVELANLFAAAGVTVLQGYGLTESSPIISFNRPERNRPGTVGELIAGVEVKIADDGEILTRGPHVMMGYYKDPVRTREAIDSEGWLHTGDVGEVTDQGFLRLTDRKDDLFKLSTGKYVMPQPLESRLTAEPLVEQAVVIGMGYKYCAALIFPDQDVLRSFGRARGLDENLSLHDLLSHPTVIARFERIVDKANRGMEPWSTIKHFALVPDRLSVESGLLTPTMKVRRSAVHEKFAPLIAAVYERTSESEDENGLEATDAADAVVV